MPALSPELKTLAAADPVMRGLIHEHGPIKLQRERGFDVFESLVSSICHQQLHGKAAETILGRVKALFPEGKPCPEFLGTLDDERLRACGLSRGKLAAIRDLAAKTLDGTVPSTRALGRMRDAAIVERLTAVRGIGPWTVEMLLIFRLARPDVLPLDDFGVRNGFRIAYGLPEMPTKQALAAQGERWAPQRSLAARYLWRAADAANRREERPKQRARALGPKAGGTTNNTKGTNA